MSQIEDGFFETLFEEQTKDGPCTWEHFRQNVVNMFPWRMVDGERLQEIVNEFFALSYKYKMQGKDVECKDMATKALRLEGSLTKTKRV